MKHLRPRSIRELALLVAGAKKARRMRRRMANPYALVNDVRAGTAMIRQRILHEGK